jgi:hypothetical protein
VTTNYEKPAEWGFHYLRGIAMAGLYYGQFAGICQLCYEDKSNFGTLVDPNGHSWLICSDCITSLWSDRQAINQERQVEEKAVELAQDAVRKLITGEQT